MLLVQRSTQPTKPTGQTTWHATNTKWSINHNSHTRVSHRAWRQHWRSWSESKLKFCREYRNSSKLSFPSTTTTTFPAPQQSLLPLRIQQSATPKLASRTFFDPTVSMTFNSKKSPQITTIGLSSRAETS